MVLKSSPRLPVACRVYPCVTRCTFFNSKSKAPNLICRTGVYFCRGLVGTGRENLSGTEAAPSAVTVPPTNMCSISSGTGCPYFVSAEEWILFSTPPGALLETPVHATSDDDGGDNGDGRKDGDGDGDNDLGSARAFLPVERAMMGTYGWPWRSGGLPEHEADIGAWQAIVMARYAFTDNTLRCPKSLQ